jgi:hypothetical protein
VNPNNFFTELKRRNVYKVPIPVLAWLVDRYHHSLKSPAARDQKSGESDLPLKSVSHIALIKHLIRQGEVDAWLWQRLGRSLAALPLTSDRPTVSKLCSTRLNRPPIRLKI